MSAKSSLNLNHLLHVAAVAIVSATSAVMLMGQRPAVPKEQYKLVSVSAGQPFTQIESQLNNLGDQGWKVRAGVGNWIVLASDR
jgi:hypothetical protein